MIITGQTTHEFYVTDRIAQNNVGKLVNVYKSAIVKTNNRFTMPQPGENPQQTTPEIENKLSNIANIYPQIFTNPSQIEGFKVKSRLWSNSIFVQAINSSKSEQSPVIIIQHKPSKHEWVYLSILYEIGISVYVIHKDISNSDIPNIKSIVYEQGQGEDIAINETTPDMSETTVKPTETKSIQYSSISEIEKSIDNNQPVKISIIGVENNATYGFYGKLYKKCKTTQDYVLVNGTFPKPSPEATSGLPHPANTHADYLVQTMGQFINTGNQEKNNNIINAIKKVFTKNEWKSLSGGILYNKIVYTICSINTLFSQNDCKVVVFWGTDLPKNDQVIMSVLAETDGLSVIALCPDKAQGMKDILPVLTLQETRPFGEMPMDDNRQGGITMAANAQDKVNNTLFDGSTLGLYKSGQFTSCIARPFRSIYDEMEIWWGGQVHMRPGFQTNGNIAEVPLYFKIIQGAKPGYTNTLQNLQKQSDTLYFRNAKEINGYINSFEKNTVMNHLTDINGTLFNEQKPFVKNGKTDRTQISRGKNYKYSILSDGKQALLFNAMDKMLMEGIVSSQLSTTPQYAEQLLNITLNLPLDIIRKIQINEFYATCPSIIVLLPDETQISREAFLFIVFLYLCGFDVAIFVPTCYNSIEHFIGPGLIYDTERIGEACYDVSKIGNIKKSIFDKIFGN